jgi:putative sigma-54 modulation protein
MEIKVHAKNINLSERLETHVSKKVERLDRYLPDIMDARMELRSEGRNNQPIAQLTIRSQGGPIFRAEDKKQEDIYAAIDVVVDKMYGQLRRYKTKRKRKRKGGDRWIDVDYQDIAIPAPATNDVADEDDDDLEDLVSGEIVRHKHLMLTPMNEEEAVEQTELLNHNFFVFLNGETGQVNVLYKRDDGNYGVLIAET